MNLEEPPSPKANILIVDDKPANLELLSQMLGDQGYQVQAVMNGRRALTIAQALPPDLVLLDIRMPEMDGYQVCQQLKELEATRHIPVIFISALDALEDKVQAFKAGGVDFISKPFQIEEVLARVHTHLQLQHASRELEQRLDELERANRELKDRNAELDAFAHTVAHDLKGPLSTLVTYTNFLNTYQAELSSQELHESVDNIQQIGLKMSEIIGDLLLLANVRQRDEIPISPVSMEKVIAEAQRRQVYLVRKYSAKLEIPQSWPQALGYAPWVEEVWSNYMSNAIKYGGQPPHVELGAEQQEDGFIRFWVRDNGDGLTQEQQAQIFTPFTRLHQERASGHGLGLSIVMRIVGKLGGQAGVDSQPGKGSTFYFTLPAHSVEPEV